MGSVLFCMKLLLLTLVCALLTFQLNSLFKWAFSASQGQGNLTGSLRANSTDLRAEQHSC